LYNSTILKYALKPHSRNSIKANYSSGYWNNMSYPYFGKEGCVLMVFVQIQVETFTSCSTI